MNMLLHKFIFICTHLVVLQGVSSNLCESNEFSSPFSNYHKLVGTEDSYDGWLQNVQVIESRHVSDHCRLSQMYIFSLFAEVLTINHNLATLLLFKLSISELIYIQNKALVDCIYLYK